VDDGELGGEGARGGGQGRGDGVEQQLSALRFVLAHEVDVDNVFDQAGDLTGGNPHGDEETLRPSGSSATAE